MTLRALLAASFTITVWASLALLTDRVSHLPGHRQELLAAGSERVAGREPVKQPDPELLLERPDTPEHGRVIDAERPGGGSKGIRLGNRQNKAEVFPVDTVMAVHDCANLKQVVHRMGEFALPPPRIVNRFSQ